MKTWVQYSICKDWPIDEIDNLPNYEGRWHYLFEPELLVRVEKKAVLSPSEEVKSLLPMPLGSVFGDISKIRTGALGGGPEWPGDVDFYGSEELHEAVLDFLHANSKLVQQLRRAEKNSYRLQRKCTHLLCNQFGMNYLQEARFYLRSFFRSLRLYLKYGANNDEIQ